MTITQQARDAQRLAHRLAERDAALLELVAMLDPRNTRSAWSIAGDIAALLKRFNGGAARRVLSGARPARGALEPYLLALVTGDCPMSQKRIHRLLVELITDARRPRDRR